MSKEKFLLVSLKESKAKELAQAVSNKTCRQILEFLADNEATESELSAKLDIPISTVHYNLQILQKAGLVVVDEFHYSKKGKEVNHYKLANKYIIIAPRSTHGIKEKLKSILPVALIAGAVGVVLSFASGLFGRFGSFGPGAAPKVSEEIASYSVPVAQEAVEDVGYKALSAVPQAADVVSENVTVITRTVTEYVQQPFLANAALWFVLGAAFAIILYLIIDWFRNR